MARGWESKSVESQIESRGEARRQAALAKSVNPMDVARVRERDSLQMSRTRVLHDLQGATNPRYRQTLEAALKHLDDKLANLG